MFTPPKTPLSRSNRAPRPRNARPRLSEKSPPKVTPTKELPSSRDRPARPGRPYWGQCYARGKSETASGDSAMAGGTCRRGWSSRGTKLLLLAVAVAVGACSELMLAPPRESSVPLPESRCGSGKVWRTAEPSGDRTLSAELWDIEDLLGEVDDPSEDDDCTDDQKEIAKEYDKDSNWIASDWPCDI